MHEIFLPLFKSHLEDALNKREVEIFIDREKIKSGQAWERKITHELIHSRIMVSIFSPVYFNSEWCRREFAIMDYRQRQCGFEEQGNKFGIIVPLKISDGDNFPKGATRLQIANFNDSFIYSQSFLNSPRGDDFQVHLKNWINDVALAYNNAPAWDDNWLNETWVNTPIATQHDLINTPSKYQPTL